VLDRCSGALGHCLVVKGRRPEYGCETTGSVRPTEFDSPLGEPFDDLVKRGYGPFAQDLLEEFGDRERDALRDGLDEVLPARELSRDGVF
jgi:hypothetical protein